MAFELEEIKNAKFPEIINEYTLGWNDAIDAIIEKSKEKGINQPPAPEVTRVEEE